MLESFCFDQDPRAPLSEYLDEMIEIVEDQLFIPYREAREFVLDWLRGLH
jgi:hypothetical protein